MTLTQRLTALTIAIATQINTVRGQIGNLNDLSAAPRSSIVANINQLKADLDALEAGTGGESEIDDAVTSAATTWSSQKISTHVSAAVTALVDGAPDALNTLKELADALAASDSATQGILTALSNRVRVDAPQALTEEQQAQARANIGALSTVEIGNPDTDFVAAFNSALTA